MRSPEKLDSISFGFNLTELRTLAKRNMGD
jgi:hypothetical protein